MRITSTMGWALGGPVGGGIALILSLIGAATLANLAYLIVQS